MQIRYEQEGINPSIPGEYFHAPTGHGRQQEILVYWLVQNRPSTTDKRMAVRYMNKKKKRRGKRCQLMHAWTYSLPAEGTSSPEGMAMDIALDGGALGVGLAS